MLTEKAIELLRRVEQHILAEPKRLNMDVTGTVRRPTMSVDIQLKFPTCHTVGCIAGWSSLLSVKEGIPDNLYDRVMLMTWSAGRKALGLYKEEAERLFAEPRLALLPEDELHDHYNGNLWPLDLARAYVAATSAEERARITVERIELFIESGGVV